MCYTMFSYHVQLEENKEQRSHELRDTAQKVVLHHFEHVKNILLLAIPIVTYAILAGY